MGKKFIYAKLFTHLKKYYYQTIITLFGRTSFHTIHIFLFVNMHSQEINFGFFQTFDVPKYLQAGLSN